MKRGKGSSTHRPKRGTGSARKGLKQGREWFRKELGGTPSEKAEAPRGRGSPGFGSRRGKMLFLVEPRGGGGGATKNHTRPATGAQENHAPAARGKSFVSERKCGVPPPEETNASAGNHVSASAKKKKKLPWPQRRVSQKNSGGRGGAGRVWARGKKNNPGGKRTLKEHWWVGWSWGLKFE